MSDDERAKIVTDAVRTVGPGAAAAVAKAYDTAKARRYSLNWEQDAAGNWSAGPYTIEQNGWHDTTKRVPRWLLRYRDTQIHESDFLASDAVDDCKRKADWHRGIG